MLRRGRHRGRRTTRRGWGRSRSATTLQARHELELDAAVLRARRVQLAALEAGRIDDRLIGTVTDGGEAALFDARLDEVRLHGLGARLRERLVVFELAALL